MLCALPGCPLEAIYLGYCIQHARWAVAHGEIPPPGWGTGPSRRRVFVTAVNDEGESITVEQRTASAVERSLEILRLALERHPRPERVMIHEAYLEAYFHACLNDDNRIAEEFGLAS